MKVFEFHFNPKLKPDLIFDSFCFEPENIYERRVGGLYLIGLLKNTLPKKKNLLENLVQIIKREYYRPKALSPERALKETLKQVNDFLEDLAKRGDVSWLGNLSFLAMGLKNFKWNFSKVGEIKIFLIRGKKLVDVEKRARLSEIEPYPLRVFGSLVSGKMAEGDAILILTKEVFDFFEKEKLFQEIEKIGFVNKKILKEIFEKRKEEVLKIFGICLLLLFTKEILPKKREMFLKKVSPMELKFKEIFSPILNFYKRFKPPKLKPKKIEFPKFKLPAIKFSKKIVLILVWILILFLGYSYSSYEEKREFQRYEEVLTDFQKKYEQAESYLITKNQRLNKEGEEILKGILNDVSPFLSKKMPSKLKDEFDLLNKKTSKKLSELNKLEMIEPELVFEFKPREFIPQKMISSNGSLYFFSPLVTKIFELEKGVFETENKLNFGANFDDQILFFSEPDQIIVLKEGEIFKVFLKSPYPEFDPNDLSIFNKNLYFLDKKEGRIVKYSWQKGFQWQEPRILIENEKLIGAKSIAIDSTIWVLGVNNKVFEIFGGKIQKEIDLEIFPEIKDFSKIYTSSALPYLFILEPVQKRIIILEKSGEIFKQFKSEKFDNLLDFSVSKDGKTIYLLNGLKLLKIPL